MSEPKPEIGALARFLQLLALASFALAQPLLDLIRRHPDFLVVHRTARTDLAVLLFVLVLAPPLLLWLLTTAMGRIDRRAGNWAHEAILALLLAVTLVPVLDTSPAVGGFLTLGAALLAALVGWWIYRRFTAVRDNLALLALTVPVFVGLFVFAGAVRTTFNTDDAPGPAPAAEFRPVSVVLVILDELPLASLLDGDGEIDGALFPNFRRLAARSTWYTRATAVSGATLRAVPAILAGRFSGWDQPANLVGHPDNVFTALGPTHRVIAVESQTSLCPAGYRLDPHPAFGTRMASLLRDVTVLYRHVVYPASLRAGLPPIDNKWSGFAGEVERRGVSRHQQFREFVQRIDRGDGPFLAVVHTLLPHSPYRHYPDGRIYFWREGLDHVTGGVMSEDSLAVFDTYRRHLLQTASVDRLLGGLLDRLEAERLLDEVMLVVTADHGACFTPGQPHRELSDTNEHDLLSVPLFIKYPGQTQARRDGRTIQSVDIYPTILATVGLELPGDLDGFPLTDADHPGRTTLGYLIQNRKEHRSVDPALLDERDRTRQWKDSHFQGLTGVDGIYHAGGRPAWTGRSVASLPLGEPLALDVPIDAPERFQDVRPNSLFVPGEITGKIALGSGRGRTRLVVAVNGYVAGSNETYLDLDGDGRQAWSILLPPSALRQGTNVVEVFAVEHRNGAAVFRPLTVSRSSWLNVPLGARAEGAVKEAGFHRTETWGETPFRWTNGRARLEVPLLAGERAESLAISLVSAGPQGTDLEILVNGRRVCAESLPRGPWEREIPLPVLGEVRLIAVEVISGTFAPGEGTRRAGEERLLGVGVARIVLRGSGK